MLRLAKSTLILLVLFLTQQIKGQSLDILSESLFHGAYYSIAISGDYAFCGGDKHLFVVSFEDTAAPEMIALRQFQSGTRTAFLQGNYVYFAGAGYMSGDDVAIVDISNPLDPMVVTTFSVHNGANDIFVEGNYAYTAGEDGQLLIANVVNPANPYVESRLDTYMSMGSQKTAITFIWPNMIPAWLLSMLPIQLILY